MSKKIHEISQRVRYAETDKMGIVYHANYLIWCEIGRVEWIRHLKGPSYAELEDQGVGLPVLKAEIQYFLPAKYDDLIVIKTALSEHSRSRMTFEFNILNHFTGGQLVKASTVHCFMNLKTGKPTRMPEVLFDLIS